VEVERARFSERSTKTIGGAASFYIVLSRPDKEGPCGAWAHSTHGA